MNGGEAGFVVAGKAQMAGQGGHVHLDFMTQRVKARDTPLEGCPVAHGA